MSMFEVIKAEAIKHKVLTAIVLASIVMTAIVATQKTATKIAAKNTKKSTNVQIVDKKTGKTITVTKSNEDYETRIRRTVLNTFDKYNIPFVATNYKHYRVLYVKKPAIHILNRIDQEIDMSTKDKLWLVKQVLTDMYNEQAYEECDTINPETQYKPLIPNTPGTFYIPLTTILSPTTNYIEYCNNASYIERNAISLQRIPSIPDATIFNQTSGNRELVRELVNVKITRNEQEKYKKLARIIVEQAKKNVVLKLDNVIPGMFGIGIQYPNRFGVITEIARKTLDTVYQEAADDIVKGLLKKE